MFGLLRGAFASLILLASLPATAAPLVVYGPGLDAADAAIAAKEILDTGDFRVHGSIGDLTGAPEAPQVVGAATRTCEGSSDSLSRVLVAARIQVTELEYAAALLALTAAVERLPCGTEQATRDELFELFFLQGFMHFHDGNEAAAKSAFTRAAAVDRTQPWPSDYSPTGKTLYLETVQAAMAADPAPLRAEVESLSVNGEAVDVRRPPSLVEGGNLLAVDGQSVWVVVPPRAERPPSGLLVTTGAKLAAGVLRGDAKYAPWLEDRRVELGAGSLLILGGEEPRVFRAGKFESPSEPTTAAAAPGPGIALVAAGGGLLGAGLALHLQAYKAAEPDDAGAVPVTSAEYPGLLARNRAGFGLAVAGGVMVGVGIAAAIAGRGAPAVAGWVAPGPSGAAVGIVGRF